MSGRAVVVKAETAPIGMAEGQTALRVTGEDAVHVVPQKKRKKIEGERGIWGVCWNEDGKGGLSVVHVWRGGEARAVGTLDAT